MLQLRVTILTSYSKHEFRSLHKVSFSMCPHYDSFETCNKKTGTDTIGLLANHPVANKPSGPSRSSAVACESICWRGGLERCVPARGSSRDRWRHYGPSPPCSERADWTTFSRWTHSPRSQCLAHWSACGDPDRSAALQPLSNCEQQTRRLPAPNNIVEKAISIQNSYSCTTIAAGQVCGNHFSKSGSK